MCVLTEAHNYHLQNQIQSLTVTRDYQTHLRIADIHSLCSAPPLPHDILQIFIISDYQQPVSEQVKED